MSENALAWKIWNVAGSRDRPVTMAGVGFIPSTAILALCELYDGTLEDFEKILLLDNSFLLNLKSNSDNKSPEKTIGHVKKKR